MVNNHGDHVPKTWGYSPSKCLFLAYRWVLLSILTNRDDPPRKWDPCFYDSTTPGPSFDSLPGLPRWGRLPRDPGWVFVSKTAPERCGLASLETNISMKNHWKLTWRSLENRHILVRRYVFKLLFLNFHGSFLGGVTFPETKPVSSPTPQKKRI